MSNKGHRQTDRQTDGPNNRDTQQAGRRDTETKWQKQRYRQTDRPNKLRDTETQRVAEIKDTCKQAEETLKQSGRNKR